VSTASNAMNNAIVAFIESSLIILVRLADLVYSGIPLTLPYIKRPLNRCSIDPLILSRVDGILASSTLTISPIGW
jgi:hypothetical protein